MSRVVALLGLILAAMCAQAQENLVRNGGFERFSGDEPVGWTTTSIPGVCVVVSPTARRSAGDRAVELTVKECFGSHFPGMITQANIRVAPGTMRLTFRYQLRRVGEDVGYVSMDFKNAEGSTIRMCEERLLTATTDYKTFTATFPVPDEADTAELKLAILATGGDGTLHAGTTLLLDEVQLVAVTEPG